MPTTNRIVIVGAGAAGVFTAYRLREMYGNKYEIRLLEANDRVGGNCLSVKKKIGGKDYSIDCGAQFFYKAPQASYVALLEQIGVMDTANEVISAPAGITIWDKKKNARRLWIPSRVGDFLKYDGADWERLIKFGLYLAYAAALDRATPDWSLSVDDWLAKLHLLDDDFKNQVLRPFMYQFVSLPMARIGQASALYAVTYFVRNVFGEANVSDVDVDPANLPGMPTFKTYQSMIGLDGIHRKVLQKAGVTAELNVPVKAVYRDGQSAIVKTATGLIACDHVVMACDPHAAAKILKAGGTTEKALTDTLNAIEYVKLPISMQDNGGCFMPSNETYWEPSTTVVDGNAVRFNVWFGRLRMPYGIPPKPIKVIKTWGAPDVGACAKQWRANEHYVPLPTTTSIQLRDSLKDWQGKHGVWFAGGWTRWFDSQEAALDSATAVAHAIPGVPFVSTGLARMVPVDHAKVDRNLRIWLERAARVAPAEHKDALARAIDDVASHR